MIVSRLILLYVPKEFAESLPGVNSRSPYPNRRRKCHSRVSFPRRVQAQGLTGPLPLQGPDPRRAPISAPRCQRTYPIGCQWSDPTGRVRRGRDTIRIAMSWPVSGTVSAATLATTTPGKR